VRTLWGWVNNAALIQDAQVLTDWLPRVMGPTVLNLDPNVVGCASAI
jgi:hypothetical protein